MQRFCMRRAVQHAAKEFAATGFAALRARCGGDSTRSWLEMPGEIDALGRRANDLVN